MEKENTTMTFQKSDELTFASDIHATLGFANTPKQYGDRMIELNKRLLKFVLQKGVEADNQVSLKIQAEVKKFRETVSELEGYYKTKIETAQEQQDEIQKLRRKDSMLTKRVEELEFENENWTKKSREQEETIKDLDTKLKTTEQRLKEISEENQKTKFLNSNFREKSVETEEIIVKLKREKRTYEEELMIFKRGSKQIMTAKESMEVSLRNVNMIFTEMKSTFWSYVMKYYKSLKAEFEAKMEEFQETQIKEYKKLLKMKQDQSDKLVSDIFKQKTELEQKNRSLDLKVTQLTHRVEGYESAMHISTKKATIKVGLEILTGDVDKRMKQQIDLYEVLTLMTEERVDEWSDTEKSTTLEEIKNFFSEEPPSTIKQHIKEVTELFKDKHIPALMSETDESMVGELEHEPQNSQATIEDMKTMDGQESEENF